MLRKKYLREKARSLCTAKIGRCKRDTADIMIASNETIVIYNVKPYRRGVGHGEVEWEKVLSLQNSLLLLC